MSLFARPDWVITVAFAHQAKRHLAPLTLWDRFAKGA